MLKLIAILLIVLSHVVQTLRGSETGLLTNTDWIVDYTKPGSGLTNLILAIISYSGQLGNMIFIICSCWFLLDKTTSNNKKLLRIFLDVFVISILYLIGIGSYIGFTNLGIKKIIKCILPNYFGNNWFITCYFVFALITPLVNTVIKSFNKQVHFIVSLICLLIYFILGFVVSLNGTICNTLIIWLALYLIISYLKTYGLKLCNSYKVNIIFITLGFCCLIIMTTLIYFVGCKVSLLNDLTKWNKVNSPFLLLIGIGLFNIFYKFKFSSKFINYISSLSFLIYVIHENILFRTYIRPQIWNYIYTNLGYNLLFVWIAIYTISLFVAAVLISALYNISLQKLVHKLSDKIYQLLVKLIDWCKTKLINVIK